MPSSADKIDELIDRWEEQRAAGHEITVEELCRDFPDLIADVRRQLDALRWLPCILPSREAASELTSFSAFGRDGTVEPQEPVPVQLGRYRLESPIGVGGFGQIWKAHDPQLKRHVAIKIPKTNRLRSASGDGRFLEEAQRLAQLRHANIVPVYDVGKNEGWFYIVTELIDGQNLADRIAAGPLGWREAARVVAAVADALHYAHEQGFIHRDVKPANILLDRSNRVFLTDFGIAATHAQLTEEKDAGSGTLAYMSPEQVRGAGDQIDRHTDIYSLGVVLYEAISGRRPFQAATAAGLRTEILGGLKAPLREVFPKTPRAIDAACCKAMAESPTDRFADCAQFARTMQRALSNPEKATFLGWRLEIVGSVAVVVVMALIFAGREVLWPAKEGGATKSSVSVPEPVKTAAATPPGGAKPVVNAPAGKPPPAAVPAADLPIAWYTFDSPGDRMTNHGTGDRGRRLTLHGHVEFTRPGDADAPPASLGTGVRFHDMYDDKLIADKTLLYGNQWSISLWFRQAVQAPEENLDFLVFMGRLDGQGGGGPELNVMMSAESFTVLNYTTESKVKDFSLAVKGANPQIWHHAVLTFRADGPATNRPGVLTVYFDGKQVAHQENVNFGPVLCYGAAPLIFGSINEPFQPEFRNRAINGVLADIRIYDRELRIQEVSALWESPKLR